MSIKYGSNNITSIYYGSNEITKAYWGNQLIYKKITETPLGDLPVGTTVYTTVNNVRSAFLIVHQGNPNSSYYGASANGTWLMYVNANALGTVAYNSSTLTPVYSGGPVDVLCETTLPSKLQAGFVDKLKTATIQVPISRQGVYGVNAGTISRRIFVPSWVEIGSPAFATSYTWGGNTSSPYAWGKVSGTVLNYFSNHSYSPLSAASAPINVWNRVPFYGTENGSTTWGIIYIARSTNNVVRPVPTSSTNQSLYIEPIMCVDNTLLVDANMDIIVPPHDTTLFYLSGTSLDDESTYNHTRTATVNATLASNPTSSSETVIRLQNGYLAYSFTKAFTDFTFEGEFYISTSTTTFMVSGVSGDIFFGFNGSLPAVGVGRAAIAWDNQTTVSGLAVNTWHKYVLQRSGSTLKLLVDGSQKMSVTNSQSYGINNGTLYIGSQGSSYVMNGYLKNVKISDVALY